MTSKGNGRKRKIAPLLDPDFLNALSVQLTTGAANALHDVQEEFVAQLTHHLSEAMEASHKTEKDRMRWVQPQHVYAAMMAMGLEDVSKEAMRHIHQSEEEEPAAEDDPPKKKRAKKKTWKKKAEFSAEMIAEQERLLAASLQKQS